MTSPAYTLYYAPGAASLLPHWLLLDLGLPHALRKLDLQAGEHKRPEYLALNPAGVVPTLLIGDAPMAESAAIALYLGDAHPQAGLAPAADSPLRPRYLQNVLRLANTLQPAFRLWFYPQEAAGEAHADAAKQRAREVVEGEFARFDAQLAASGPYLLGAAPSVADFYLTMLMRWSRNMPRPATEWPALAALAQRMKSRDSFKALYASEELTEWA